MAIIKFIHLVLRFLKLIHRIASILFVAMLLAVLSSCSGPSPQLIHPAVKPDVHAGTTPGQPSGDRNFTILQINDVYRIEGIESGKKGGLARVRTLRQRLEAEGRQVLVLHAGDVLFPSVMSKHLLARPMIETLNLLDGDAAAFDPRFVVVFGNHEFDNKDPGILLGRVAQSDFRWLSSNTRYCTAPGHCNERFSARVPNVHDTLVVDIGGIKVGLFGLTTNDQSRPYVAYDGFGDASERAALIRSSIERLRGNGAQVIVALTHEEFAVDVLLARSVPEIDLVVGGHEHFFIQQKIEGTWIAKADADAVSAIVWDVKVSSTGSVDANPRRVMLDNEVMPDPIIEAAAKEWGKVLGNSIKDPFATVATTEHELEGVEPAIRGRETALGNFLADVIKSEMKTDVAFVNGGAVRINDNIPAGGVVRNYELEGIFYFASAVVSFELTGQELLETLRASISKVHLGEGRFLQVSGIRFKYFREGSDETPTYRIEPQDVEVAGKRLDLARRYSVTTLDNVWENGWKEGFGVFAKSKCPTCSSPVRIDNVNAPVDFRAATEAAITKLPNRRITTAIEGRIQQVQKTR